MKRYNKVKAGLDDRKKFGRKDVIEKDSAAQTVRDMLALKPGLKVEQISNNLFAEYGVRVSGCWVSRLLRKYNIQYRVPKPKKIRKVRVPKRPREPEIGTLVVLDTPEPQSRPMSISQYQLPPPNQFPAFRQDSYQALRATSPNPPPPPPATFRPVANQPDYPDVMFGILKLDNVSLPKHVQPQAPAGNTASINWRHSAHTATRVSKSEIKSTKLCFDHNSSCYSVFNTIPKVSFSYCSRCYRLSNTIPTKCGFGYSSS
jgi:hypothetical protein